MPLLTRLTGRRDHRVAVEASGINNEKQPDVSQESDVDTLSLEARNEKEIQAHPDRVTADAPLGMQKAEAAALVWSRKAVFLTYAWIWVCFFMLALQQSILSYATAAAFATFDAAPAASTASILAIIIGGVLKLPIAKMLNVWGRAEGYTLFVGVYLLGMILLASANSVNTYAAGYVLYWIGYDSIYIILDIFIADTSGLRNRAFTWAFASTPFICTVFVGPRAAASFLTTSTWHWSIGTFCIIQPFVFLPLAIVFKFYQRKAEKLGLFRRDNHGRTFMQSAIFYFHEFDVIGALLLMAAFILFLLPFSLVSYGRATYDSATFIAMVVVGILLFPVFYAWERYLAPTQFMNWRLLRERTVLGACVLAAVLYFSFYTWDAQYYSFVLVVYNLTYVNAGYMIYIYDVGSVFWGVVFGVWVRYTKHFKYTCLFFGVPLMLLGSGLMIYFRGGDGRIGYIIMCQIFIAFGGGTLVIGEEMAVMAAADREGVPMMLSLIYLASSIGGAIGQSVAVTIYYNTWPAAVKHALPAADQAMAETLYLGGYLKQLDYAAGTAIRDAIDYAWGRTQYWECTASTCFLVLAIPAVAVWKNYNVDKKQNKGTMI